MALVEFGSSEVLKRESRDPSQSRNPSLVGSKYSYLLSRKHSQSTVSPECPQSTSAQVRTCRPHFHLTNRFT